MRATFFCCHCCAPELAGDNRFGASAMLQRLADDDLRLVWVTIDRVSFSSVEDCVPAT